MHGILSHGSNLILLKPYTLCNITPHLVWITLAVIVWRGICVNFGKQIFNMFCNIKEIKWTKTSYFLKVSLPCDNSGDNWFKTLYTPKQQMNYAGKDLAGTLVVIRAWFTPGFNCNLQLENESWITCLWIYTWHYKSSHYPSFGCIMIRFQYTNLSKNMTCPRSRERIPWTDVSHLHISHLRHKM